MPLAWRLQGERNGDPLGQRWAYVPALAEPSSFVIGRKLPSSIEVHPVGPYELRPRIFRSRNSCRSGRGICSTGADTHLLDASRRVSYAGNTTIRKQL